MWTVYLRVATISVHSSSEGRPGVTLVEPGSGERLLPPPELFCLVDQAGEPLPGAATTLGPDELLGLYRALVVGRRFDRQATALTKQGRLAVYPSANGQEACQVGSVLALRPTDWIFPTYRESVALVTRGVDPVGVLTLLRGDWHLGYDPREHRAAPQCTPLATQALHAVGLADAARRRGEDLVVLAFVGDGATSEGDFHEALNFASVWRSPVVFFVQNNHWAISVPLAKQTNAPTLAHKGIGYGLPGRRVDGNDVLAVHAAVSEAATHARGGGGPVLIEALTYRMDGHTNSDDPSRYRGAGEVAGWRALDPIERFERHLRGRGLLDDDHAARVADEAEELAADVRRRLEPEPSPDPMELFANVYAEPTPQLREQADLLAAELSEEG
jgi:2-oxoisovalerate dehydrogenase E1 component subunit alpha